MTKKIQCAVMLFLFWGGLNPAQAVEQCQETDPNIITSLIWSGAKDGDGAATLNGSVGTPGHLAGRQRVCFDSLEGGQFTVTPLLPVAGDNAFFRFVLNPPNSVQLGGPPFGRAEFSMGDVVYTGSLTADEILIDNRTQVYPGSDVVTKQLFNGADLGADNILITSTDNDFEDFPVSNTDFLLTFTGGGVTALENLTVLSFGNLDMTLDGASLNANTMELHSGLPSRSSLDLTFKGGSTSTVQGETRVGLETDSITNLTIEGGGTNVEWSKNSGITGLGVFGNVDVAVKDGALFKSHGTFLAFAPETNVTIDIDGGKWETDFLAAGGHGQLNITATGDAELKSTDVSLGHFTNYEFGHLAQATLEDNAKWDISGFLNVGATGDAQLSLKDQSTVNVGGLMVVGDFENAQGTVDVRSGDTLKVAQTLEVGRNGDGLLRVEDGGVVESTGDAFVGTFQTGNGEIQIRGEGSRFETKGNLNIGNGSPSGPSGGVNGIGSVLVEDGGELKFGELGEIRIGRREGSEGELTLKGAASKLTAAGQELRAVKVGVDGKGTLNLEDGFQMDVVDVDGGGDAFVLGSGATGEGRLNVKGEGTQFKAGHLTVGELGKGEVLIDQRGSANLQNLTIGSEATDHENTVTVQGEGSVLFVEENTVIGDGGIGVLKVKDKAELQAGEKNITLGKQQNSRGTLSFEGSQTSFTSLGSMTIGGEGEGTLEVLDGAIVNFTGNQPIVLAGDHESSKSNFLIKSNTEGVNSTVSYAGDLTVGAEGQGKIEIDQGGVLRGEGGTDSNVIVGGPTGIIFSGGSKSSARGEVSVKNGGLWEVGGDLRVGKNADGFVRVENGGIVDVKGDLSFGTTTLGEGTLHILGSSDAGASPTVLSYEGAAIFGERGKAHVTIENGGQLIGSGENQKSVVGGSGEDGAGVEADVLIKGQGSEWRNKGEIAFALGHNQKINVTVQDGGELASETGAVRIGEGLTSETKLTVKGSSNGTASALKVGNQLVVGSFGTGELLIEDGAKVVSYQENTAYEASLGFDSQTSGGLLGGDGKITVKGKDSLLDTGRGDFWVGDLSHGNGHLEILDGGRVESGNTHIAGKEQTTVVIQGTSDTKSEWEAGIGALARVVIEDGTRIDILEHGSLSINANNDVPGLPALVVSSFDPLDRQSIINISGAGAELSLGSFKTMEVRDSAKVTVANGGKLDLGEVSSHLKILGSSSGASTALVEVKDGGVLSNPETVEISAGSLRAASGGSVSLSDLIIGHNAEAVFDAATLSSTRDVVVSSSSRSDLRLTGGATAAIGRELKVSGQGVVDTLGGAVTVGNQDTKAALGSVLVNYNGTVSGTGTIKGTLIANGGGEIDPFTGRATGGIIKPGESPGMLTIDGDFILEPGATLEIQAAGTDPGLFDQLFVTGLAEFKQGSFIELDFLDGYLPQTGDLFAFIDAELGISGLTSELFLFPDLAPGFAFDAGVVDGKFTLAALNNAQAATPEPRSLLLMGIGLLAFACFWKRDTERICA